MTTTHCAVVLLVVLLVVVLVVGVLIVVLVVIVICVVVIGEQGWDLPVGPLILGIPCPSISL